MAEKDFHVTLPQEVVGGFGWKDSEVPGRVREALVMDLLRVPGRFVVGSPRGLLPEAPTDPDVRISRIRLFGPRFCYVTGEVRSRG